MTKTLLKVSILGLLLFSITSFSQSFIEKQLPSPKSLNPLFIGPIINSTIHYGAKPPNFNGEVILFNHGYIDLNQLIFLNNSFYEEAYNAGFQTAFVATTRGEGMWENGELLAESIDIIRAHFNVNDLYIIAHSNGGKAAEVAMIVHNKKDYIKKVFALGTPYWGTYLADISEEWWFRWFWKQTGLRMGSATSTTYYCRDVARPYLDNHINNQPEKFVVIGASGFNKGHGILAPIMFSSGSILYLAQGTNDGVTPYSSSLRPNATYIFEEHEAELDHIDVGYGQFIWQHITPYLNQYTSKEAINNTTSQQQRGLPIVSDYQIINSENNYDDIIFDNNNLEATIDVYHENNSNEFQFLNNDVILRQNNHDILRSGSSLEKHISRYKLAKTQHRTTLNGNARFTAFVHQPKGVKMIYEAQKQQQKLNISFKNTSTKLNAITVNAIITKTGDLYGNKIKEEPAVHPFEFHSRLQSFSLDISPFDQGTYSVFITGEHKTFKRSLISGFTVGSLTNSNLIKTSTTISSDTFNIELKSNIIHDKLEFESLGSSLKNTPITVSIYNLKGQLRLKKDLHSNNNVFTLNYGIQSLSKGLYIVSITQKEHHRNFKVIKQ